MRHRQRTRSASPLPSHGRMHSPGSEDSYSVADTSDEQLSQQLSPAAVASGASHPASGDSSPTTIDERYLAPAPPSLSRDLAATGASLAVDVTMEARASPDPPQVRARWNGEIMFVARARARVCVCVCVFA